MYQYTLRNTTSTIKIDQILIFFWKFISVCVGIKYQNQIRLWRKWSNISKWQCCSILIERRFFFDFSLKVFFSDFSRIHFSAELTKIGTIVSRYNRFYTIGEPLYEFSRYSFEIATNGEVRPLSLICQKNRSGFDRLFWPGSYVQSEWKPSWFPERQRVSRVAQRAGSGILE